MNTVQREPSIGNLSEWLEGFEFETSPQIRRGMLEALFDRANFIDTKGLNSNNQLVYITRGLSLDNVTDKTIQLGFNLAMQKILWRRPIGKWPNRVRKETLFGFLSFLEIKCYRKNVDSVDLRYDYLKNFVESMVMTYQPKHNTRAENSLMLRSVFRWGELNMLTYSGWFGSRLVISELLKKFPEDSNPFASNSWTKYSSALAIHLARSGKLTDALKKLRKK